MKKIFLTFPLLILVSIFIGIYILSLPPSQDSAKKVFVINQGEDLLTIGSRLQKYNFVKNKYVFAIYSYFLGFNKKIQAGTFYLTTSADLSTLIKKLASGGSNDYWLKIIPGTRLEEFSPSPEFTLAATNFEGQLFPDSYLIPEGYSPEQILDIISTNFNKKLAESKINSSLSLSDSQALILASILEREARTIESKKMVAGVLLNRLKINMPLQVDASVQYARDSLFKTEKYWQPISKSDLTLNSPYNTYKNRGLPPSPICNPGLESLIAAYHPISSEYLFYITGNDHQMHYAKTLDEHNTNVAKYLK